MYLLPLVVGILVGCVLPLQTSANTKLSDRVGSSFASTLTSFIVSGIFSVILVLVMHQNLNLHFDLLIGHPFWVWTSGAFGAICVVGSIIAMPKIGSVQTVIMLVLGQIVTGLLVDHFGFFGTTVNSLTLWKLLGAILLLVGVFVVVSLTKDKSNQAAKEASKKKNSLSIWIFRLVAFIAGVASAIQTGINGYVGTILDSPYITTVLTNIEGIIFLIVVILVTRSKLQVRNTTGTRYPAWIWFGGIYGTLFVIGNIYLAHTIGIGMTVVLTLIGQMLCSLILDTAGILGVPKKKLTANRIIGLVIMIVGAVIIHTL